MWTCPNCGRTFKRTNQNHYCGKAPATVDAYIEQQAETLRPILNRLKKTIRDAIPDAQETIAWSMPTWKKNGNIIHFAVNPKHIGIYVDEKAIEHFSEELKAYDTNKGVLRLDPQKEIPYALVAELAKWGYRENQKETK